MKKVIRNIPIPICGLILGLVSIGNLFKTFGKLPVAYLFGFMGMALMLILCGKLVRHPRQIIEELKSPVVASVAPTFSMSWMVISTYFELWGWHQLAFTVWVLAIIIHFILMGYFIKHFIFDQPFQIQIILPSWFVTFIGIGVIPVTSPSFNPQFGVWVFWIGLGLYVALLPVVFYRIFKYKLAEQATWPLLLTGYLSTTNHSSQSLTFTLLIIAQGLYLLVLTQLPKLLKLKFYPSYAAFTFPLVISATAVKLVSIKVITSPLLSTLSIVELVLATIIVLYVLGQYVHFFHRTAQPTPVKDKVEATH